MHHEACCIIHASEVSSKGNLASGASWLRDLLISSDKLQHRDQLSSINRVSKDRVGQLRINRKDNIFKDCPMEKQLVEFAKARTLLGLTVADIELQAEACYILSQMDDAAIMPSEEVTSFMRRLIYKDKKWLSSFRQRAGLPIPGDSMGPNDENSTSRTIDDYPRLQYELGEYVKSRRGMGADPSDDELRRHARVLVHESQDNRETTAADDLTWLNSFKQQYSQHNNSQTSPANRNPPTTTIEPLVAGANTAGTSLISLDPALAISTRFAASPFTASGRNGLLNVAAPQSSATATLETNSLFMNGSGNYRQFERELARYVASCMSSNNPTQHTPTDQELRHQARWILYDE